MCTFKQLAFTKKSYFVYNFLEVIRLNTFPVQQEDNYFPW